MIQQKVGFTLVLSCFVVISIFFIIYWYQFHVIWYQRTPNITVTNNTNTTLKIRIRDKCHIPNYTKTITFREAKDENKTCGERVIFVKRISHKKIIFIIDESLMFKYYNSNNSKYECCYKSVNRSKEKNQEDRRIIYSDCKPFNNGSQVEIDNERLMVVCHKVGYEKVPTIIYEDAYLILIKQEIPKKSVGSKWNVLAIGIDTMSRARLLNSMPRTFKNLKSNDWLDFKGYQKVAYSTFPNLMAVLSGMHNTYIYNVCSSGMHLVNHLMLWSDFKNAGYKTAYAEDYLSLPDTFERYGFKIIPTDHYTRPFFLIGEHTSGNLICTKHLSSPNHILNYAYDFAEAYKNDGFFGLFWLNSLSHNLQNLPSLHDYAIDKFLNKLNETENLLNNTFVILFSDHGIKFGDDRIRQIESYYAERLPMLFIWTPLSFRKIHEEKYVNLQKNQQRLITPLDLHLTLNSFVNPNKSLNVCPLCTSLFNEVSESRDCTDIGVSEKWCTCHGSKAVDKGSREAKLSINTAVHFLHRFSSFEVKTKECKVCGLLHLKEIIRIHSYQLDNNRTIYIVAFEMKPGKRIFEANIMKENDEYKVIDYIFAISPYGNTKGCALHSYQEIYCNCFLNVSCSISPLNKSSVIPPQMETTHPFPNTQTRQ